MHIEFRRIEILLPLRFNDDTPVPNESIVEVELELEDRFGAISSETQLIRGHWQNKGHSYMDDLLLLVIDIADTAENRQFFHDYKEQLKTCFQQKDIWMTTYKLEVN